MDINKLFLLKENVETITGQKFRKGEILFRYVNPISNDVVYIDFEHKGRRLFCADKKFERLYTSAQIDTLLAVARGFVPKGRFEQFKQVVHKKLG